jgi:hypothetical protein
VAGIVTLPSERADIRGVVTGDVDVVAALAQLDAEAGHRGFP